MLHSLFRFESFRGARRERVAAVALRTLMVFLASAGIALADADGDGVPDDGDLSGSPYDNPCPNGVTANCDDNCRLVPNAGQTDVAAPFGVGDDCHVSIDPFAFPFLGTAQQVDAPTYRWRGSGDDYASPAVAVNSTLPVAGGGTCAFDAIPVFGSGPEGGPVVRFDLPPSPPYGGLACCGWEAKCNLFCAEDFQVGTNCDAGEFCPFQDTPSQECSQILFGTTDFYGLTTAQRDQIGLELQDGQGPCASVAGVPFAACCFEATRTVDYYWGSEALNPLEGVDSDGDLHPEGCDNCPTAANSDQLDGDGDGRGAECDTHDNSRWACSDTDADGCDDCTHGSFDPSDDGIGSDPQGQCLPEPSQTLLLGPGLVALAGLARRRRPTRDRGGADEIG